MARYGLIAKSAITLALFTLSLMTSLPAEGPEPMQENDWSIETVDTGDVGLSNSLALDSMDNPHIAYYDQDAGDLRYTRWNGTTWNTEIVDSAGDVGRPASLALDIQDYPHIAYEDFSNYELKYARWTGSAWDMEIVDPGCNCGAAASLALDSSDTPHISYTRHFNPVLLYAKRIAPDLWTTEILDSSGHMNPYSSIAVDSKDNVHISFHMFVNGSHHYLKYAKWNGTTWNIEIVDETDGTGWYNSIALDSQDNPHISYHDEINGTLKYARWNGMEWVNEVVDSEGDVGWHTSIAIDSTDNPHIGYHDAENRDLKYAVWNGTTWNIEVVDTVGWAGYPNSIAINSSDGPHIAYHDCSNGDLKYARKVEAIRPSEPIITASVLSGPGLEDVVIIWDRSADDGAGKNNVIRYDIYASTAYTGTYSLKANVPADGSPVYSWICLGCGEGDPNNHFFYVEANDSVHSTPSPNKGGKFTRPLSEGPNLVSVPLIQSDESVETVLQTVEYDKAWYYDSFDQEWRWHMTYKEYRRGLWKMNHTMGIWVNVTEDSNLTVAGIVPAQTMIHLYKGWNLVSFPSFNGSYRVYVLKMTGAVRVEGYNPSPPYHLRILGDGEALQAGYGYWVRVEADVIWTITVE